jgi:eukaryotic-like serine/threonine-protein kinase
VTHPEDAEASDPLDALVREAARISATVASQRTLRAGTTLVGGRVSILRKLGEGGMGVVYEAFDAQRRGRVALKTLSRVEAAAVYRLKNEFRALSDVTHPNLVQLYELFAEDDAWFFTMEVIEGERFDRWTRPDGRLDEARLRAALPQLVAAVDAVHTAGKLHRDLKPSNVLVTAQGRVVVLDFGLTVDPELGGVGHTVADETVSGTPAYMSPEQAAGRPASAASDFYALGAMLFESLTGRLPFEGHAGEMLAAKQRDQVPDPHSLAPGTPGDLAQLCLALLAREATERPARAALFQALRVTAPHATATRASVVPGATSDLLGREAELAMLRAAYTASVAGRPTMVFVSGESGMGKSALTEAFVNELRAEGQAVVLAGRCYERENVPYKGFDALVDELSRYLRALPAHEAAALLPREVYALARLFPVLNRVSVVAQAPRRETTDPQELKRRAFEAFGELLTRMRDRRPLVVVLDDLQWIDEDSVRFMRMLLLQAAPAAVLWLCVHRSEDGAAEAALRSVREAACDNAAVDLRALEVGRLSDAALSALAQRLLPADSGPELARSFAEQAHGSAFFAGQLVRASRLREAGAPPPALGEALSLHLRSLPEPAQHLLSLLALAGQPLSPLLAYEAARVADGPEQLDRLRREQLVRISFDAAGARRVECYHDKIREHVTAAIDTAGVRTLAYDLAQVLLVQPALDHELLLRLLTLSGRPEQAAEHAALAAERALSGLAFARAAALYEQALALGTFEDTRRRALRVARAEALAHAGRGVEAAEAFLEAAPGHAADVTWELRRRAGEQYLMCGELQRGNDLLAQALRKAGIWFPRMLLAALLAVFWSRLRLRLRGLRYEARTTHAPATLARLDLLSSVAQCLARTDPLRGADFVARWTRSALDSGHELHIARALGWEVGVSALAGAREGRVQAMSSYCEQICDRLSDRRARMFLTFSLGIEVEMRHFDVTRALPQYERALTFVDASQFPSYDRALIQTHRLRALLGIGRTSQAGETSQAQLEDATARGDHTVAASLAVTSALCALAADRPDYAERLLAPLAAHFRPDAIRIQDFLWLQNQGIPLLYQGKAREAWYGVAAQRERYLASFQRRFMMPGVLELSFCGIAVAASYQAHTAAERRALLDTAAHLAKRTRRAPNGTHYMVDAAVAFAHGDRQTAIAALRKGVGAPWFPVVKTCARRRLGEVLGGSEGECLIAEADAALRAGGVVDPVRFASAMMPGIELR